MYCRIMHGYICRGVLVGPHGDKVLIGIIRMEVDV